jgi:hypothetical protein
MSRILYFLVRLFRGASLIVKSQIYKHRVTKMEDLAEAHFSYWSSLAHPNYQSFSDTVKLLDKKPAIIIETGSSAWGTDSTRLWDSYVSRYGGSLVTIDVSSAASKRLKWQLGHRSELVVSDSVTYLRNYSGSEIDFAYLDSWDVDPNDPVPSAQHGLNEFEALYPHLKLGGLVLVDDTPRRVSDEDYSRYPNLRKFKETYSVTPGKGAFILANLHKFSGIEVVSQEYSLLLRYA